MKYDALVIGAGPAGCSAALSLRNRGLSVLAAYTDGGALAKAHQVNNYLGLRGQTGADIVRLFRAEAAAAGAELREARVTLVLPMGKAFSVAVDNDIVTARAIVLACGAARSKPLEGEKMLLGRGVSYCATCDGMLYRGKKIIVVGSDTHSIEEANFLSTLAQVIYIPEQPHDVSGLNAGIAVIQEKPVAVLGDGQASGLRTDKQDIPADGVFILRPAVAPAQLIKGLNIENGAIAHDAQMRTNLPHVYVAGDAAGLPHQAAKAAGEGNIAALTLAGELVS